jgi:hypothetical protein
MPASITTVKVEPDLTTQRTRTARGIHYLMLFVFLHLSFYLLYILRMHRTPPTNRSSYNRAVVKRAMTNTVHFRELPSVGGIRSLQIPFLGNKRHLASRACTTDEWHRLCYDGTQEVSFKSDEHEDALNPANKPCH